MAFYRIVNYKMRFTTFYNQHYGVIFHFLSSGKTWEMALIG